MKPAPANLNALWARAAIEELVRGGVREAVVCPGSRSTPLALACAEEPALTTRSIVDERSAAFFALGAGKASQRPALVVATSGTAGAHFYPAIIEAQASGVPLIALTADRPPELHGWGAPQTIDQQQLFGAHVRFFADLGLPEAATLRHLRSIISRACDRARGGPVHLNAPFREPLAPVPQELPWALDHRPALRHLRRAAAAPDVAEAARELSQRRRGLIVCGPRDAQDELPAAVQALSARLGYPVIAEAASQVRFALDASIACADAIVRDERWARALAPEAVVRIGGGLTSKALQAFLSGAFTVVIAERDEVIDPAHDAALALCGEAPAICRALERELAAPAGANATAATASAPTAATASAPTAAAATSATAAAATSPADAGYTAAWAACERRARRALADLELSEPLVARETVASLSEGAQLFVSSSMPVRDVDAFAFTAARGVRVLSNRGVNGIDGVVSSALGAAAATGRPTTLLLGDLAFLHDLGGLLAARRLDLPLTIVVVNNDGGGIFSFLPVANLTDRFEELFGTPHGLDLAHAAALCGARLERPQSPGELRTALREASGLTIIEVRTDRALNVEQHRALQQRVSQALGSPP